MFQSRVCPKGSPCHCVYADTGERVHGTRGVKECEQGLISTSHRPCENQRETLCDECSPLACDESTGRFLPLQCLPGDVCFCVHPLSGQLTSSSPRKVDRRDNPTCTSRGALVPGYQRCGDQDTLKCSGTEFLINQRGGECVYRDTGYPNPTCSEDLDPRSLCDRTPGHVCNKEGGFEMFDCGKDYSDKFCTNTGRNRQNQEILVSDWLITNHVT